MLCLFYVGSGNLCIARKTTDLINMSTYANLLLIQMKRQDSECVCIILLVKNIFEKHFQVFHEFTYTVLLQGTSILVQLIS